MSWACEVCTFLNIEAQPACAMCETMRPPTQKKPRHTPPRVHVDAAPLVDLSADALLAELEREEQDGATGPSFVWVRTRAGVRVC